MILRDAVISDQRRMLGPVVAPPLVVAPAVREAPREPVQEKVDAARIGALIDTAPVDAAPIVPPRENKLSLETVAAWLAVQDAETRSACASILAGELVQVHEAARVAGHAAGREDARVEAERTLAQQRSLLQSLASKAEGAWEQECARLGDACVDVVTEALAKVAGPLLTTREAVVGVVVEVLRRVREGRELTIRVCHADLPVLQQDEAKLAAALPGRSLTLLADPRVDLGGCIVESRLGSLDGRLEVQLRELYATLRSAKSSQAELP